MFSRRKRLFYALTLKRTLGQGNYYRRACLVTTRSTCRARLVAHVTHLTTLVLVVLVYLLAFLVCPLVVLVCPLVVSVCSLAVLVALSEGLFITDLFIAAVNVSEFKFSQTSWMYHYQLNAKNEEGRINCKTLIANFWSVLLVCVKTHISTNNKSTYCCNQYLKLLFWICVSIENRICSLWIIKWLYNDEIFCKIGHLFSIWIY